MENTNADVQTNKRTVKLARAVYDQRAELYQHLIATSRSYLDSCYTKSTFDNNVNKIVEIAKQESLLEHACNHANSFTHYKNYTGGYLNSYYTKSTFNNSVNKLKEVLKTLPVNDMPVNCVALTYSNDAIIHNQSVAMQKMLRDSLENASANWLSGYYTESSFKRAKEKVAEIAAAHDKICAVADLSITFVQDFCGVEFTETDKPAEKAVKLKVKEKVKSVRKKVVEQDDGTAQHLPFFKRLWLNFLKLFMKKQPEKTITVPDSDLFAEIKTSMQSLYDKTSLSNETSKKLFDDLFNEVIDIEKNKLQDMLVLLPLKNTVMVILPKLMNLYNSVNSQDDKAEDVLQKSLTFILADIRELKKSFAEEEVKNIEIFGEFIKQKYVKQGM